MTEFQEATAADLRELAQGLLAIQQILTDEWCSARLLKSSRDLDWLQRIVDERLLWPDQVESLEAMGVVLGEVLVAESDGFRWWRATDGGLVRKVLRWRETPTCYAAGEIIVQRFQADLPVDIWSMHDEALELGRQAEISE